MASVNDSNGKPLANPGLWGIVFGNGASNQPATTLYFAAGISAQTGGLYGRIDPGATPPDTVAPKVTLTTSSGTVSGTVALTATATDNVGVVSVKFLAGTTLVGTATKAPFTVQWDTTTIANGAYQVTAQAADAAGNTTTSAAVAVTVANTAAAPMPTPTPPPPRVLSEAAQSNVADSQLAVSGWRTRLSEQSGLTVDSGPPLARSFLEPLLRASSSL